MSFISGQELGHAAAERGRVEVEDPGSLEVRGELADLGRGLLPDDLLVLPEAFGEDGDRREHRG
jgi:hypothetical protein